MDTDEHHTDEHHKEVYAQFGLAFGMLLFVLIPIGELDARDVCAKAGCPGCTNPMTVNITDSNEDIILIVDNQQTLFGTIKTTGRITFKVNGQSGVQVHGNAGTVTVELDGQSRIASPGLFTPVADTTGNGQSIICLDISNHLGLSALLDTDIR